jgi:hypothetical protein
MYVPVNDEQYFVNNIFATIRYKISGLSAVQVKLQTDLIFFIIQRCFLRGVIYAYLCVTETVSVILKQ